MPRRLTLRLLGAPCIELEGAPIETDRRKAIALLAYLAVTGKPHSREALATLFWPDYEPNKSYAYLRRTLWEVNQAVGEGWVEADRETVSLPPTDRRWVDVLEFQALLAQRTAPAADLPRLNEAIALYRGDFLAGFALRDSPDFETWQAAVAEALRGQFGAALETLTRAYAAQGEHEAAIAQARRWLALDTLNEAAHRQLMELFALTGQRTAALRQYETCAGLLQDELQVQPQAATTGLFQRIKAEEGAFRVKENVPPAASPPPSPARRINLPAAPTPFVGRQAELAQIADRLADPPCRLLTLVGPGGMGKTRLSIEAARSQAEAFPHGVYFVALAPLPSADWLIPAMAEALKFSFRAHPAQEQAPPDAREQLWDYVREKQLLLVLDNFEHLVPGAELLSDLLAAAPGLKILVTSRERLNLREEAVLEIRGMAFPEAGQTQPLEAYSAIKLFLQSAQRVRAEFALTEAERPAISRICQQVAGMPLGIELAAGWVKTLTCQEIVQEIERNLDFLTTSQRGVPERHRSLRAVFEHSWALLTEAERDAFRKLSIFQGGFTREAAAQIAGASLAQLATLIDKSLLRRNAAGRYELHELLKQFAAAKLAETPAAQAETQAWHSEYYLERLADTEEQLKSPAQKEVLANLEAETDNLRLAWHWAVATGQWAELGRATSALLMFYDMRGLFRESEDMFRRALDKLRPLRPAPRRQPQAAGLLAAWLAIVANLCWVQEHAEEGRQLASESLALTRRLPPDQSPLPLLLLRFGDGLVEWAEAEALFHQCMQTFEGRQRRWETAMAHIIWGNLLENRHPDLNQAEQHYRQGLNLFRQLGDPRGLAMSLNDLSAIAYWRGAYTEARQLAQETLTVYQASNDRWQIVNCRLNLGQIETALGDYEAAKRHYRLNLEFLEEVGQRAVIAAHLDCLGYVEYLQGHYQAAERYDQRSLEICRERGDPRMMAMALNNLGDAVQGQGQYAQAKQYYLESLAILTPRESGLGWAWGRAKTLKNLGRLALQLGDQAEAEAYLGRALQVALQAERTAETLEILVGLARVELLAGHAVAAAEILARVAGDGATPRDTRVEVETLFQELAGQLDAETLAAARQHGQAKDISAWLKPNPAA